MVYIRIVIINAIISLQNHMLPKKANTINTSCAISLNTLIPISLARNNSETMLLDIIAKTIDITIAVKL